MFSFYFIFMCSELYYWLMLRREDPFVQPKLVISQSEFDNRLKRGEQLVVLDNLVLDVSRFKNNHPGGRFLLEYNVGKDISKYFYGCYIMEVGTYLKPWTHSNQARKVINTISIGQLSGGDNANKRE